MLKVDVDARKLVAKLKVAARRIRVGSERALDAEAELTRERITTRYWTNRNGYTAEHTKVLDVGTGRKRIEVQVPWGEYLNDGTPAHVIEPKASRLRSAEKATSKAKAAGKNKRKAVALGPMLGGKFFRRVRHPGTKPLRFVEKESKRAPKSLARRMQTVVKNATK